MTKILSILAIALFSLMPSMNGSANALEANFEIAQSMCQNIGQRVAAERGATLLAASETTANGAPACEVVMLLPAQNGERPRREVMTIPR